MAQTTNVPNTVRCECEMTKSEKCVGCWMERSASTEPWKQTNRYMTERKHRNVVVGFLPKPSHRPITVPKKFTSTVHTGIMSNMEVTIASVWDQSAIGL